MKVTKAEIVISAVAEAQYPDDNLPEIVLLGRSNVGKSTFVNTLIERRGLARTSSQPGKTQTMNFYRINDQFHFVDMPGYGYAKASKTEREKWGKMIEKYLRNRNNATLIFQLIDSRHEPSEDDILMYEWLVHYGLNPLIIGTKADKISKINQKKSVNRIANILNLRSAQEVILFSSETKLGKEVVWEHIENVLK
ncbi:ribosome biogenesis GTP-binding protein YihA/YsxC [Acetobacterium woodii]|uniref:Probable GTP-binding protein EngB n=1 Tax=Acetobacterium woodii (strain ATCC 29683 / DSM 1030 / JCM 2381 / KCTC 1655 / WB1) TaxID=931626 RepID=H6LC12_ACEWD|nr:ribosome biogenesis GTP-binding protein YihA/YsxC [Acetobacterium woodii]AFA48960.1 GTP-binding protein EngB [Acetobacterium woodii DSM 1030]